MRDLGVGHHGDQLPLNFHQHVPCLQAGLVGWSVNPKNLLNLGDKVDLKYIQRYDIESPS